MIKQVVFLYHYLSYIGVIDFYEMDCQMDSYASFLEDVIVFPELSYLLFSVHKIQVRVYFVIHFFLQNKTFKAPVL